MCILLCSCVEEDTSSYTNDKIVCNCEQNKKRAEWLAEALLPSNNYSDEEMEDVIKQLTRTSYQLFCSQKTIQFDYKSHIMRKESKLDSCDIVVIQDFYY